MFDEPKVCPLTHVPFHHHFGPSHLLPAPEKGAVLSYLFPVIGRAYVPLGQWAALTNGVSAEAQRPHYALAGLCREAAERGMPAPELSAAYFHHPPAELPVTFPDKMQHFLRLLYDTGGNVHQARDLNIDRDFPMAYADGRAEFSRMLERLVADKLLDYDKPNDTLNDWPFGVRTDYYGVLPSAEGRQLLERQGQGSALAGLVRQVPPTQDVQLNAKIQHAKDLFFKSPASLENMRSACVALCAVLEPLRPELKTLFFAQDVHDFFGIVNQFDIRHNNEKIKQMHLPEQFEYVFFGLLNLINTYYKLQRRTRVGLE